MYNEFKYSLYNSKTIINFDRNIGTDKVSPYLFFMQFKQRLSSILSLPIHLPI